MSRKIDVGVVGLGKFGLSLAQSLRELGHNVLGVDLDNVRVRKAQEILPQVYQADGTDKTALEQLGFSELDYIMVSIGNSMEASILVALNLQDIKAKKIWVKAVSPEHEKVLKRLGVHFVVFPEKYVARQLAHRMAVPGILDYLPLGEGILVQEVEVRNWSGKTLRHLNLPSRFDVQVVAVKRSGRDNYHFVPRADASLNQGDKLVLLGNAENVMNASKQQGE